MKNKKGSMFLPTKTLDLVLGVIVIGLLFFAGFKLTSTFLENNEERQAKATLEEIKETIKYIEDNSETNHETVLLLNPNEWYVIINENNDLICICQKDGFEHCNERELCYLSGYDIKEPEIKSIKIRPIEKEDEKYFKSLNISLDKEKREINFSGENIEKNPPNPSPRH